MLSIIIILIISILVVIDALAYRYFLFNGVNKEGVRMGDKYPEVFEWTMVVPLSSIYILYRYIKFRRGS